MANPSGIKKNIGGQQRQRRYPGISGKRPDLKATRVKSAQERKVEYDKLTLQEKLTLLEERCKIHGGKAEKQRNRLELELARSGVAIEVKSKVKRVKAKDRRSGKIVSTDEGSEE